MAPADALLDITTPVPLVPKAAVLVVVPEAQSEPTFQPVGRVADVDVAMPLKFWLTAVLMAVIDCWPCTSRDVPMHAMTHVANRFIGILIP
jgi:hypothetical protein